MKKELKTIYLVGIEDPMEVEAMFDEKGTLLSYWFANDAHWRDEYFSEFMAKIGIFVSSNPPTKLKKKMENLLKTQIDEVCC